MPRHGEDTHMQSSAPEPLEQYRPSVSRLKVGETLQTIRRTAQDLYRFQDNVGGRSALVHGSNPAESHDDDVHGTTKPPVYVSQEANKSQGSIEVYHVKNHQSRPFGVSVEGASSPSQQHFLHLSTDISCHQCGEISSPEWRSGPKGPGTLCNVCGLIYAKQESHRRRDQAKLEKPRKRRLR